MQILRKLGPKLALSLGSLLVIFGGGELICRYAGLGPVPGSFRWVGDDRVGYLPMQDQQTHFGQTDPETGLGLTPIRINHYGQRGADFPLQKPPGERRIAVVGDSLTMGNGVLDEECFPARLEQLLRADDPPGVRTRVVNAAVNGWNTWNYAQWAKFLMPDYDPDLLVVGLFLGNDMVPAPEGAGVIPIPLHSALRNSALYHWMLTVYREILWKHFEAKRLGKTLSEFDQQLEEFKGKSESQLSEEDKRLLWEEYALIQLLRIRDAGREQGVEVVVLLIPTWGLVYHESTDELHDFLRQRLEGAGVRVATCLEDLRPLGRAGWLDWDEGHLSPAGNRVVAEALARQLP
ncbi:MAG TPA: SGNH/GDSL hydrolase family protein [Planctomycetota bacterium]|nr:SGNH/GDSL hydrolase family protein [Planctomycetota bacterium]